MNLVQQHFRCKLRLVIGPCDCFRDGQEIIIDDHSVVPENFCASAWRTYEKIY